MLLDFDMADLGKYDTAILDPHGWVALQFLNLGIAKAIIAVIPLEAWEAGGFAFLHSFEEGFERFIHPFQGILQDLRIDLVVLRSNLFDLWELGRLIVVEDANLAHAVGFTAFLFG